VNLSVGYFILPSSFALLLAACCLRFVSVRQEFFTRKNLQEKFPQNELHQVSHRIASHSKAKLVDDK